MTTKKTTTGSANVLPFDPSRFRTSQPPRANDERQVVALVTVTRFINGTKVHAQVPVFADQILRDDMSAEEVKLADGLSELLADGAVEANAYLDRMAATQAARPVHAFYSPHSQRHL